MWTSEAKAISASTSASKPPAARARVSGFGICYRGTPGPGGAGATGTASGAGGAGAGTASCSHGPCDLDGPLDPACDPCVATVCAKQAQCCTQGWDILCISTAVQACGQICPENGKDPGP
ncbi:MAG: hypothetical protein HY744_04890 [Deltaproteobacteria bacterium]|nr:hypothetical protein [Deltaproteobacteria bacterium]